MNHFYIKKKCMNCFFFIILARICFANKLNYQDNDMTVFGFGKTYATSVRDFGITPFTLHKATLKLFGLGDKCR